MAIVDTIIAKNRSTRIRMGVGMCTLSFPRGAVRDLSKLRITAPGGADVLHGWEIHEKGILGAFPKWPDGSYMNALAFVTHAYVGVNPADPTQGVNRYEVHDDGSGGGLVHELSCTDAGSSSDFAFAALGEPPGIVHELSCTDAGMGFDAAHLAAIDDVVHELTCTDAGSSTDTARMIKVDPGAPIKRFEGEIRFPGPNIGETREIRFKGTIDTIIQPKFKGKVGTFWSADQPEGVPAAASSGGSAPAAARYSLTRRRERNEWESGGVIHRTYWELQDALQPNFHQGWVTIGFSDPRTTELAYETTSEITMHPRAGGAEIGVWWSEIHGATRIEDAGVLQYYRLAPAGTRFVEGQCFGMRYGATNIPVAQIPEGLDRESALAQCDGPIWMMSEQWRTAGNFSWNGVVSELPATYQGEAGEANARAFIRNWMATSERPPFGQPHDPFWGGWILQKKNRGEGDQSDFSSTMETWPAARLNEPLFLEAMWPDILQEACCRSMAHRREAPDFKGRGPAAPYRHEDHPNSRWYSNGPIAGLNWSPLPPCDLLGKLGGVAEEGFPIATHGHDWHMMFQSHYGGNYLTGAYLMTGDPQLEEAIWDLCEQLLSSHNTKMANLSPASWSKIDQARAFGRELILTANLIRCTNREDMRALMRARILDLFANLWPGGNIFPGQRPVRPGWTHHYNAVELEPFNPWLQPWGEAQIVVGLYAALLTVGNVNDPNDPIRLIMNQIGETLIMYQWENTFRNPPNYHIGAFVAYNNGQPVTPANPLWHNDAGTSYVLWALGASRIMQFFGADSGFNTGAAIRARAKLCAEAVGADMDSQKGFGQLGGFGRYGGWRSVLP